MSSRTNTDHSHTDTLSPPHILSQPSSTKGERTFSTRSEMTVSSRGDMNTSSLRSSAWPHTNSADTTASTRDTRGTAYDVQRVAAVCVKLRACEHTADKHKQQCVHCFTPQYGAGGGGLAPFGNQSERTQRCSWCTHSKWSCGRKGRTITRVRAVSSPHTRVRARSKQSQHTNGDTHMTNS